MESFKRGEYQISGQGSTAGPAAPGAQHCAALTDDLFLAAIEDVYVALLFDLERALAGDAPVREREIIKEALRRADGNKSQAARVKALAKAP